MITNATVLSPSACTLGESPLWHAARRSCFWADIEERKMFEYRWAEKTIRTWHLPERISLIRQGKNNELVLGLQGGIYTFNLYSENLTQVTALSENWQTHRCNDGAFDSMGRLWIGTMQLNPSEGFGSLYCISSSNTVEKKIAQVTISNGITWSADNTRMYYIDSATKQVDVYFFNEATGEITFEKTAIKIPAELGLPDGMAMDEKGCLWIALWGGYGVGRWDVNTGEMIGFVKIPVPFVTSCAFVGNNFDELLITTASQGMDEAELKKYPQSGYVFTVQTNVKGLPVYRGSL